MSASDSDYSIDWLASDDEESELEPECQKRAAEQVWCLDARQRLRDQVRDGTLVAKDGEERERHPSTGCDFRSTCLDSCGMEQNWASESPPSRKRLGQKRPHSPGLAEHHNQLTANQREKNLLFASKCMELQCYIPPLSSILNGLRSGRYRERLSSFQESVAMDRIQRIMGVLQNPHMGERYVNIVLKMEEMLKSWFPHIKPQNHSTEEWRADTTPSKKQKLSMPPLASPAQPVAVVSLASATTIHTGTKTLRLSHLTPPGYYSATHLKWLHTSPICSPSAEQAQGILPTPQPSAPSGEKDLTQDNSVSSSTDAARTKTDFTAARRPPLGKINAPCLERLLKSTESIITQKGAGGGVMGSGWS